MRWEPLLLIILLAGLSGLLIVATGRKRRWFALLVLGYLTGLAAILFTPISFSGTAIYIMPIGIGRVNLTNLGVFNLGFLENIVLTIPLGLLVKWMLPKLSLLDVSLLGLFVGGSVETMQYVLSHDWLINRSSDINDVLANALGILVGGLVVVIFNRITGRKTHTDRVIA
ncbi:VanZ family protein [Levilactobacillus lindianensis]|uniref:VanZ family protein n=1 Tax=Levilactobacillus lindianensis TaxID=2486018 RepID=UPI000F735FC8|nr:VanZ family protein [Levilactobacillus lindianensis]